MFFCLLLPHAFWVYYGWLAKVVSLIFFLILNIIFNDMLYIVAEIWIIKLIFGEEVTKVKKWLGISICYFAPGAGMLSLFIYNFIHFSKICTEYMALNIISLIFILIYLASSLFTFERKRSLFISLNMSLY